MAEPGDGIEELYDALHDLRSEVVKQGELQAQTNDLLRALISTLQETAQEMADLREALAEDED